MKLFAVLRLLCALALVAPLVCQDETQPYFALASNRTFGSRETPAIMLTGWHVDAVQIRVYRVKDALKFFRQMEDPHSFGGHMPRPEGKRTLLERIHDWKRGLRRSIRFNLSAQFTQSPRASFASLFPRKPQPGSQKPGAHFAEVPLLNRDQLVLSFTQPLTSKTRWNSASIP